MKRGAVKLKYVATDEHIADVLTKPLARVKFEYFREKLGVLQIEVPSKGKSSICELNFVRINLMFCSYCRFSIA